MNSVRASDLGSIQVDLGQPTVLYQHAGHAVYWLGISHATAFRCNVYLIADGDQAILVDPGSRAFFSQVRDRVADIMPPERVTGMILCHQDPDVAASMVDWLEVNADLQVFASPRTHVLLPHYGKSDYRVYDIEGTPRLALPSGAELSFVPAPFLHFPGAFATFDRASGYLYSGDVWAALDIDWTLVVHDFDAHRGRMELFHKDYMASRVATQGFVRSLAGLEVSAILPQHGSIIGPRHVQAALDYLSTLECGLDLIYADLGPGTQHAPMKTSVERVAPVTTLRGENTPTLPRVGRRMEDGAFAVHQDAERRLREALAQATRLAALRDRALQDLRLAEQRLVTSESRLAEAQRVGRMGHWDWNIPGDRLALSDEVYRIFGLSPGELDGGFDAFLSRVHPDDRAQVARSVGSALRDHATCDIEHRVVLPDGGPRMVHQRAEVSFDAEGTAIRMLGTLQDITERMEMEHTLRRSEARNRLLLEAAGEGILGLDASRRISFVNPAALRSLGYTEEELIGKELGTLWRDPRPQGGARNAQPSRMLAPFSDGQMVRVADEMLWRKDGTGFPVEYVAAASGLAPDPEAVVVVFSDISERLRLEAQTKFEASHDSLTRLLNRRVFMDMLRQECQRAVRYGTPLSLIMYDVDHFKVINDSHGHLVGDAVLVGIVEAVNGELRNLDKHCRWGGEEFLVMTVDTGLDGAHILAERIRRRVEQTRFDGVKGVTLSLGVTSFEASEDVDTLLRRADALLYRAKRAGRNRVQPAPSLNPADGDAEVPRMMPCARESRSEVEQRLRSMSGAGAGHDRDTVPKKGSEPAYVNVDK